MGASDNINSLFLLSDENKIQSINAVNGQINWSYEIGGKSISNFVVSDNALFVANTTYAKNEVDPQREHKKIYLRSINVSSGVPFWATEIDFSSEQSSQQKEYKEFKEYKESSEPITDNAQVYLADYEHDICLLDSSGSFACANKREGVLNISKQFESKPIFFFDFGANGMETYGSPPAFAFQGVDKNVYFVPEQTQKTNNANKTEKNENTRKNENTGKTVYRIPRPERLTAAASLGNKKFVAGDDKGNISLIDLGIESKSKDIWKTKIGGSVSSVTPTDENILVTSLDNFVYLINQAKGKKIWKKRLSGRLLFKPLVIDNEIDNKKEKLIIVVEGDAAYLITLDTGKLLNRLLLLPSNEYFIGNPVSIRNQYILQTNSGIISFSDKDCL